MPLEHSVSVVLEIVNAPDFAVAANPAKITTNPGKTVIYNAIVSPLNGFTGNVAMRVENLPAGVTATFNPVQLNGGGGNSVMTVVIGTGAAIGSSTLNIFGKEV